MDSYREYPIKCKTCNEQIACFSNSYETLILNGTSVQNALDSLGITAYCSRIAMMTPTIVTFDMENREAIEGIISVNMITEETSYKESTSPTIYSRCIEIPSEYPTGLIGIPSSAIPSTPTIAIQQPAIPQPLSSPLSPILPLSEIKGGIPEESVGISIQSLLVEPEFVEPTKVGISTINVKPLEKPITKHVGVGRNINVLPGRTYLAQ